MHPVRTSSLACLVLGLLAAAPVVAQTPSQRTLIEAFRDSLDRVADSVALARVEAQLVAGTKGSRANALDHLRLGFLSLRQADLGATRDYEDAASEFQWVTRLAPAWPYGWYGLGLAEYGVAITGPQAASRSATPPRAVFGRALGAFARAAAADPRFADILVEDAFAARRQRQATRPMVLLEAVRVAGQSRSASAQVLAALGRIERELGDPKAALKAFESSLPTAGRGRGLALLEVARTRFLLGRNDGSLPYYDGAVFDDSATVGHYRADLSYIATETELRAFDRASGAARAAYLHRFWAVRDAADMRNDGERLQEHYRRVYFARRSYPLFAPVRSRDLGGRIAVAEPDWDDRGVIYVRHGEPDDRVQMSSLGVEPNQSWRYTRAEGDLVLHFVARHELQVYRLVESLFDVADAVPQTGVAKGTAATSPGQEMVLRSRETLSTFYQRGRRTSETPERDFRLAERAMSRGSLVSALASDTYRHGYAHRLGVLAEVAVIGSAPGGSRLYVAFTLPFDAVGATWLGAGQEYPLRFKLIAFDLEGRTLARVDSLVRPRTLADGTERWLAGIVSVPLPEGRLRLRVAVEDGDTAGTMLPLRSIEVTSRDDGVLAVSDLALGPVDGPWRAAMAGGADVALNPVGVLRREDSVELAYEVTAPLGARLTSQVTVIRVDAQAGVVLNERFTEAAGRRLVRHGLALGKLKAGSYRVEVTLADGRGGLARRWREFRLAEGRTGGRSDRR
jgi:GWxTD domain-containing protein